MGNRGIHLFLLFAFVFGVSLFKIRNPDLGFHLVSGRYLLETLSFPRFDFATFTRFGLPDYPHSILPSALFYMLHKLGGFPLLVAFKAFIYATTFSLIFLATPVENKTFSQLKTSILLLIGSVAALVCRDRLELQPFMFTDLCFAFLLFELPKIKANPFRWRHLFIFTFIFGVWFNVHLGVIHGIAVFGIFCCTLVLHRNYPHTFHIFKMYGSLLVLVGVLSALVNPSSANIWPHLFLEIQNSLKQQFVAEYQSGILAYGRHIALMVFVFACLAFVAIKNTSWQQRELWFPIAVFMFFLGLTLKYQREITHLAMAWFFASGSLLRWIQIEKPHKKFSLSIVSGVLVLFFLEIHYPALAFGLGLDSRVIPQKGFATVRNNLHLKRLYNSLSLGGWWTFFLQEESKKLVRDENAPGKIFHDGRGPLFTETFFQQSVLPILRGEKRAQMILDQYQVDAVALSYFDPLCSVFTKHPYWELSYFDEAITVFSRRMPQKNSPFSMLNPCVNDSQVWHQWEKWSASERQRFTEEVEVFKTLHPLNPRILFIAGILETKQNHLTESSKRFFESGEVGDIFNNAYGNAGTIACSMGQYSAADVLFEKAKKLMVADSAFWDEWTQCLRQQKRSFRAAVEWAKGQVYLAYFAFRG